MRGAGPAGRKPRRANRGGGNLGIHEPPRARIPASPVTRTAPITAIFTPVPDVLATIPAVFEPVAHVFTAIANVFEPVAQSAVMTAIPAIFEPVANVLTAVQHVFTPVTSVFATITNVLKSVTNGRTARGALRKQRRGAGQRECGSDRECVQQRGLSHNEQPPWSCKLPGW